jgi:septal ring factor EnvC (AmiA/AmiB activator)
MNIKNFRSGHRRQLEQMQSQMEEVEVRYKTEISRIKSKLQNELDDIRLRYDSLKKIKSEMENHLKKLQAAVKEAQDRLIEEQSQHAAARDLLGASEKRFGKISVIKSMNY